MIILQFNYFKQVLLTPLANLPPVLLIKVPICHRSHRHQQPLVYLTQVSLIPVVHLDLQISPQILEQKFEVTLILFSGALGKMIHEKTPGKKSCDTVPLNPKHAFVYSM
jgi:hypothetical protein